MNIWISRLLGLWSMSLGLGTLIRLIIAPIESTGAGLSLFLLITLSIVLLLVGFYSIQTCYKTMPGMLINPLWVTRFNDSLSLVFGGASMIAVADYIFGNLWGVRSVINDDFILFMSVFFLLFGIPILAFYNSRLTFQTLEVDEKEITLHSMSGTTVVRWEEIESFKLSDEYILVGRVGILIPRTLQKRLKVISKRGDKMLINEPQIKSRKKTIIAMLKSHIPKKLLADFSDISDRW